MFSNDLKKNISAYQCLIDNLSKKENINKFFDNLDIILKLIGYDLINTPNISLIKIILDFLDSLYLTLAKYNYKLNDIEYNIVFSILIEKLSINNNSLKEKIIYLINRYIYLINIDEIVPILLNICINKNNTIKLEIINIIINLYKCQNKDKYSHIFISSLNNFYLSNTDKSIQTKCIFLFKIIYSIYGNNLWNILNFDEKLKKLIETNEDNNINISNGRNSFIQLNKDYFYIESKIENDNVIIKNGNNKIFYNTSINFNPNRNYQNQLESLTKERNIYNKIKVKKIDTIKNSKLMNLKKKKNYKSLNNSFNNNHYKNYSYNYNSEDIYSDIFNYNNIIFTKEELISKMNNLLSENYLIKINSIIILHEIFCLKYEENKILILNNIEQIIDIFLKVIKDLFTTNIPNNIEKNFNKFAKYTVTTLCKLLSNKELIINISYKTIYTLSEEIINFLLNNEDLIEENEISQEKNIIFKSLNSSMMRILDNYNTTSILLIFFELINNYYNKNIKNYNLFILTILKCLEKKTQNFEKIISDIEIDAILLQIHLLLNKINQFLPDLNPRNEIDIKIISFIKNFLFEVAGHKKEKILEDYNKSVKSHFIKDKYMIKWINDFIFKNKEKEIKGNIFIIKLNNRKKNSNKNYFNNSYIDKVDKRIITSFSNKSLGKFK